MQLLKRETPMKDTGENGMGGEERKRRKNRKRNKKRD